jgi:hypothetical protein
VARPPAPEILPEKVVEVLMMPTERVAEPRITLPPAPPPPEREPIELSKPERSRVAPAVLERVMAELFPKAEVDAPALRVPKLIVVEPV